MRNVLFVCIGNSCRSQMAEGFARAYGSDVMKSWSAGLAPTDIVQPLTIQVMLEKNIDITEQFPKNVRELELSAFDVVVNMSGVPLPFPLMDVNLMIWHVVDPMTQSDEVYRRVRDQIEGLVMQLIMDLRRSDTPRQRAAPVPPTPRPVPAPRPIQAPPPIPAPPPIGSVTRTRGSAKVSPESARRTAPIPSGDSSRYRLGRVRKTHDH